MTSIKITVVGFVSSSSSLIVSSVVAGGMSNFNFTLRRFDRMVATTTVIEICSWP